MTTGGAEGATCRLRSFHAFTSCMTELSLARVLEEVKAFRAAVERYVAGEPHQQMKDFPEGRCKLTSLLLARHLAERGLGDSMLIANAARPASDGGLDETHAWLELDGLTIDLTADQFPNQSAIIVTAGESPFHRSFSGQTQSRYMRPDEMSADFRRFFDIIYEGIEEEFDRQQR